MTCSNFIKLKKYYIDIDFTKKFRIIPLFIYYLLQKQAQQHGSMAIPQQPQLSKPDTASADIPLELATSGEM